MIHLLKQGTNGRLPTATRPHNGNGLAGGDCEVEIREHQHLRAAWVCKGDILEFDGTLQHILDLVLGCSARNLVGVLIVIAFVCVCGFSIVSERKENE